jgi:hypothetical protein
MIRPRHAGRMSRPGNQHETEMRPMRLEYRSNNAYDTIIMVDLSTGLAVSRWAATEEAVTNFLDATQDADDWDTHHNDDNPDEFGDLLAWRAGTGPVVMSDDMARASRKLLDNMQADIN